MLLIEVEGEKNGWVLRCGGGAGGVHGEDRAIGSRSSRDSKAYLEMNLCLSVNSMSQSLDGDG